ncbi:MAG: IS1380 family transposase [Proteobacteria bacterium]|nr:IS1380 family transposase [Pseudomonadota bacterium]MBU4354507.1 IS1380 family transposase [Pseudomonadota bacterium]
MLDSGESRKEVIRPDINRAIMIDFQGATISSDTGFILLREVDERFRIIDPMKDCLEDLRSPAHTKHALVQMVRQRVYQIAAGYEDCNDADYLRIDPALRLAIGKDHKVGAGQSMLSRLENDVLGNAVGLEALDGALSRAADALLKRKNKRRLIIDLDSTEDPAHGNQEGVAYNGHFAKNCFHPLFCFTSDGDCLGARLRPGNVHSANGALEFIGPIVKRYRTYFKLFWFRGDAAFAKPGIYEYCEEQRITCFIRLPANENLDKLVAPNLSRPVGRPPQSGIQVKIVDLHYKAKGWSKPRRVVAKIEWHRGELFPRIGFVLTNSRLPAAKVTKVYNGRAEIENRIKEGKNTLRWDNTSCQRFEANQARLKMGILAYNLLHMIRQFYVWGEEVRRSIDWLIKRLIKVGARISYHVRRWYVHVASAFPLAHHYRAVLAWGP